MKWLGRTTIDAIHQNQIEQHGGLAGIRDENLLESAIARPRNLALYKGASVYECAASYCFGLVKNHPFVDGNKRVGFMAAFTFLYINGVDLIAPEPAVVIIIEKLASGVIKEKQLAHWLKANSKKIIKS